MKSKRALLFSALFLGCTLHGATRAQAPSPGGSITILDERGSGEISEISRLYIDGNLVATFRLGLNTPSASATIALPVGRLDVDYALCGEITILHDGHTETHRVSGAGQLHHATGHTLDAVGSDNFTDFFLVDYDDDSIVTHHRGPAAVCAAPSA